MTIRLTAALTLVAALLAAGCEPQAQRSNVWVNPLDPIEARLPADPKDNNYILTRMEFGHLALALGCPQRAQPRLKEAFDQLGAERDNTAAALSSEQLKFYKGETYERAMMATYLGLMEYQAGEFNNARIYLSRALSADRAAVVKESTPAAWGEDFGLAYFWMGRTFARLGDADNGAIALRKAAEKSPSRKDLERECREDQKAVQEWDKDRAEGEAWAWKTFQDPKNKEFFIDGIVDLTGVTGASDAAPATLPGAAPASPVVRTTDRREEFFTPAYQADTNFTAMIEVGRCPFKYLTGMNQERTETGRPCIAPRRIRVYVDGHYAGEAMEVLDLWEQAATQDRIGEKDAAQATKSLLKTIAKQLPYAGSVAGYWDVSGDMRYWTSLPGKVFIFAAKIAPGPHTVRLEMYDACGRLLPRWTNTYYGLPAPKDGETCLRLGPACEGDNRLPPAEIQKALKAGAKPGIGFVYGYDPRRMGM